MLNTEKTFIRSVDASPEKVIFIASNQQLTDLADFFAQTIESSVLSVLTLHIMLDHSTPHLRHIHSYNVLLKWENIQ